MNNLHTKIQLVLSLINKQTNNTDFRKHCIELQQSNDNSITDEDIAVSFTFIHYMTSMQYERYKFVNLDTTNIIAFNKKYLDIIKNDNDIDFEKYCIDFLNTFNISNIQELSNILNKNSITNAYKLFI
jgi:hypothetical protein